MRALAQKYMFAYLMGHSPRYFQENFAGKLGQKVKQAGQATVGVLAILAFDMVRVAMLMLVGGVLMFLTHATYAIVLAVWAVLYLAIVSRWPSAASCCRRRSRTRFPPPPGG